MFHLPADAHPEQIAVKLEESIHMALKEILTISKDQECENKIPFLLPLHALPLYYVTRDTIMRTLWPSKNIAQLIGLDKAANFKDSGNESQAELRSEAIFEELTAQIEHILSQVYSQLNIQVSLLAIFGGCPELIQMLSDQS
jgi:hypothetical protein